MRQCPFDGCKRHIPDDRFACPTHWFSLNATQRSTIWGCYSEYTRGEIGVDELRMIQKSVLDEAQGKTTEGKP
jgi:hypothetical protein